MNNRCIWRCIAALTNVLVCAGALAAEQVTLQLKWHHSPQFAGYYAALEQGYYKEAGLDVSLMEATPETDVVTAVTSGAADFGVGSSNLLLEHYRGKPVVVLANIFQHSALVLVARQWSPTQNIHDLAGKRLMLTKTPDELVAYLQQEGLSADQYSLVPHSADLNDLITGKTDALSTYSSIALPYFEAMQYPVQVYSPRAVGIDFYGDNLFTSSRLLKRNPDVVEAFRKASLKGWQYAMDHPDAVVELIRTQYNQHQQYNQQQSDELLRKQMAHTRELIHPELIELGYSNPGRWRHIADTYASLGLLPKNLALNGFLYRSEVSVDRSWLYITAASLIGAFVVFLVAAHINRVNQKLRNMVRLMRSADVWQRGHNHVLAQIVADDPLEDILLGIIVGVEHIKPDMLCSILLVERATNTLRLAAAPHLPDFYNEAVDGLHIARAIGSCGTAVITGQRVITKDIQNDPAWASARELAAKAGLASCWSEPIINHRGEVLGTFAIYQAQVAEPSAEDIKLIEESAYLAEIAIGRKQAIEALRESEERHRIMAQHDSLTGLPNRALFSDRLQQALSYSKRHQRALAVMLLDLDKFKPVNDQYGHALGDELLKQVARRLLTTVRHSDTVARIGGDEFVILLHQIDDIAQAKIVSEKIQSVLNELFVIEDKKIQIGCCIGTAFYPQDSQDAHELTQIADQRMYHQKHQKPVSLSAR
ncbi:ABC transporter substrate-binding protein [Cellvibrio sp. pealriver]|uniref:ABC transporter substrate-binding protein n=1 Tax=Cellvibrio sp. pealriver TaxID=1622269 RepID=UPI00069DBA06|nr:ABC transporter substrate-binding protein [Cellvibrio sp. pealriver]